MKISEDVIVEKICKLAKDANNSILDHRLIRGPGDDCSAFLLDTDKLMLSSVDSCNEGIHFLKDFTTPERLGARAVCAATSDIYACGGKPSFLLVAISCPSDEDILWVERFMKGLVQKCREMKMFIAGGDVSGSFGKFSAAISVSGLVKRDHFLKIDNAEAGDLLCISSFLGNASAGLAILKNERKNIVLNEDDFIYLKESWINPPSYVVLSSILCSFSEFVSVTDCSDGLLADVKKICRATNTGAKIFLDNIPISDSLRNYCKITGQNPNKFSLYGGEDYNLLFTARKHIAHDILSKINESGEKSYIIGEITVDDEIIFESKGEIIHCNDRTFDHFGIKNE